jgi:catechol 2,3-dioxygenase-like lactoylglutathione lyase family enzyme
MSTTVEGGSKTSGAPGTGSVDMKLEVLRIPVSDAGRAKDFYASLGWRPAAHGEHEKRIGAADPDWPDWYAAYMVAEQAGTELPR